MDSTKKMGGKYARTRGHNYEREIANVFNALYPDAKRKLEYQISDCTGVDISNVGPFKIQCKRGKKYAPLSKIKEIQEEGIHLLVTKGDREKSIACLYLDDFIEILKDIGVAYE